MSKLQGMDANTSQCVCDHLARACDELGEAIAFMHEERPPGFDGVEAAFATLHNLRAEIGFLAGQVVADQSEIGLGVGVPFDESEAQS